MSKQEAQKPEEAQKTAEAAPAAAPKVVRVRAIHGRTIHPFTGKEFDTDAEVKTELDSWTQIQIDAGKLEVVVD